MHRLLRRQLRKLYGDSPAPPELGPLLAMVDDAYRQADLDRIMVERSLELSSEELLEANRMLRERGDDLERRVAQRAAQLESANRDLGREVGERSRAERRAALAEERLRTFIEALPAITYIAEYGSSGRWEYVSPQVEAMLGIPPESLLARTGQWYEMVHPEDRPALADAERRASSARAPFVLEYRMVDAAGRTVWVRDQAVPAREGERPLYQGVILDISERKGLEADLLQVQKVEAIGRLAGGVAHDFNNMLTAITGYAELLRREVEPSTPAAEQVDEILLAARRATTLTSKLLAFGRRQVLQPRELDLSLLVSGLLPMIRRLIGENIALESELDAALGAVRADPTQIEQVLINLVINARDAMPEGGVLRILTENRPGPHVAVAVEDSGSGIDAEVLPLIFEPFFTTKPLGKGTGLGLSTAYGIVRQSGGEIRVDPRPGKGARFEVLLPRSGPKLAAALPPAASEAPAPGGSEAILVAEDEPAVRELTALTLRELGYRVTTAADGADALALADRHGATAIDLLVTDVVMPRLGGVELAEQLRADRPGLPVLFVSGYAEGSPLPAEGLALDRRDGYLQKPFTRAALARRVREILDREL